MCLSPPQVTAKQESPTVSAAYTFGYLNVEASAASSQRAGDQTALATELLPGGMALALARQSSGSEHAAAWCHKGRRAQASARDAAAVCPLDFKLPLFNQMVPSHR